MAAAAWSWVENLLQLLQVHLGPELLERLDQHGRLDGHVQAAGDAGAGQRLRLAVLPPQGHQAGHLSFGKLDLLAAPIGQGKISDFVRQLGFNLWHRRLLSTTTRMTAKRERPMIGVRGPGWQALV